MFVDVRERFIGPYRKQTTLRRHADDEVRVSGEHPRDEHVAVGFAIHHVDGAHALLEQRLDRLHEITPSK